MAQQGSLQCNLRAAALRRGGGGNVRKCDCAQACAKVRRRPLRQRQALR